MGNMDDPHRPGGLQALQTEGAWNRVDPKSRNSRSSKISCHDLFFCFFDSFCEPKLNYFSHTIVDKYVFSRLGVFIDPNPNLEF